MQEEKKSDKPVNSNNDKIENEFTINSYLTYSLSSLYDFQAKWHTFRMLFIKPVDVVTGFISNKNGKIMHPIEYVIIMCTLLIFLNSQIDQKQFSDFFLNILKYITIFFSVPFSSFLTYFIFKNQDYNYGKHLVLNSYGIAHSFIFASIGTIIEIFFPTFVKNTESLVLIFTLFLPIIYITWFYISVFNKSNDNYVIKIIKAFSVVIIYNIFELAVLFVIKILFFSKN